MTKNEILIIIISIFGTILVLILIGIAKRIREIKKYRERIGLNEDQLISIDTKETEIPETKEPEITETKARKKTKSSRQGLIIDKESKETIKVHLPVKISKPEGKRKIKKMPFSVTYLGDIPNDDYELPPNTVLINGSVYKFDQPERIKLYKLARLDKGTKVNIVYSDDEI